MKTAADLQIGDRVQLDGFMFSQNGVSVIIEKTESTLTFKAEENSSIVNSNTPTGRVIHLSRSTQKYGNKAIDKLLTKGNFFKEKMIIL